MKDFATVHNCAFALLARVLRKMQEDEAIGLLVHPLWDAPWNQELRRVSSRQTRLFRKDFTPGPSGRHNTTRQELPGASQPLGSLTDTITAHQCTRQVPERSDGRGFPPTLLRLLRSGGNAPLAIGGRHPGVHRGHDGGQMPQQRRTPFRY